MTPPQPWVNGRPVSCGKVRWKLLGEGQERRRRPVQPLVGAAAVVVDRVVAAPQDAVVVGEPVVVELVAGVGHPVPVRPADRRPLLAVERRGDQRVVPHRHHEGPQPADQRPERVGGEHGLAGPDLAVRRAEHHHAAAGAAGAAGAQRLDRRVLVQPDAGAQAGVAQAARQPRRVDHGHAVAVEHARRGTSASSTRSRTSVGGQPLEPGRRVPRRAPRQVPQLARPATARSATVSSPVRSQEQSMPWSATVSSIASRFSRPSRSSVAISSGHRSRPLRQPVGEAGGAEPAVAAGRGPAGARAPRGRRRRGRGRAPWPAARSRDRCSPPPTTARSAVVAAGEGRLAAGAGAVQPERRRGARRRARRRPATGRPLLSRSSQVFRRRPATSWPTARRSQGDEEHRRADDVGLRRDAAQRRHPDELRERVDRRPS